MVQKLSLSIKMRLKTGVKDFGTDFPRFDRLLNNVEQFRLKETYTLASIFEVKRKKNRCRVLTLFGCCAASWSFCRFLVVIGCIDAF